jgi:hypothetical protein
MYGPRLIGIGISLALSSVATARVVTIDIKVLAKQSPVVVVGTVTYVREVAGVQVAFVDRTQFLKGFSFSRIAFVAEPTWACDTSNAVVGERVVLYLCEIPTVKGFGPLDLDAAKNACAGFGANLYALGHSGRGRIPLFLRGNDWFARVRLAEGYPPELNVNLTAPWKTPLLKESERSGFVRLGYFSSLL